MRILVGIFLVLLALGTAAGVAVMTGAISFAEQGAPVPTPKPNPAPAQAVAQGAQGGAAAPAAAGDAAAPQQQIKVVKKETYGDWIYTCLENQSTKAMRCSISQELSQSTTKQVLFTWRITQDGKGGLVAVWQTPQGVSLRAGIVIDAGTPKPVQIPYETCASDRCQAVANLAPDFQDSLSKAAKAVATITLMNGRAVNLPLSVKGLADGLTALKAANPPG
jgi:invasion protein IalB